jgi:hypothetical protein
MPGLQTPHRSLPAHIPGEFEHTKTDDANDQKRMGSDEILGSLS